MNVNQAQKDGATPLYIASQNGHPEVASLLLAKEGVRVNQALEKDGLTPLFIASRNGHTEVVSLLLAKEGVVVNHLFTPSIVPFLIAFVYLSCVL